MTDAPAVLIGESFVGEGAEAAHINTVLGHRSGPVGMAWATALATPSAELVYANNRAATKAAVLAAVRSLPDLTEVLAARAEPSNPFYRPK